MGAGIDHQVIAGCIDQAGRSGRGSHRWEGHIGFARVLHLLDAEAIDDVAPTHIRCRHGIARQDLFTDAIEVSERTALNAILCRHQGIHEIRGVVLVRIAEAVVQILCTEIVATDGELAPSRDRTC